jgi:hypothetical protein
MAKASSTQISDVVSFSLDVGGSRRDTLAAMRQAIHQVCAGIGRRRGGVCPGGRGLNARH